MVGFEGGNAFRKIATWPGPAGAGSRFGRQSVRSRIGTRNAQERLRTGLRSARDCGRQDSSLPRWERLQHGNELSGDSSRFGIRGGGDRGPTDTGRFPAATRCCPDFSGANQRRDAPDAFQRRRRAQYRRGSARQCSASGERRPGASCFTNWRQGTNAVDARNSQRNGCRTMPSSRSRTSPVDQHTSTPC